MRSIQDQKVEGSRHRKWVSIILPVWAAKNFVTHSKISWTPSARAKCLKKHGACFRGTLPKQKHYILHILTIPKQITAPREPTRRSRPAVALQSRGAPWRCRGWWWCRGMVQGRLGRCHVQEWVAAHEQRHPLITFHKINVNKCTVQQTAAHNKCEQMHRTTNSSPQGASRFLIPQITIFSVYLGTFYPNNLLAPLEKEIH